MAKARILAVDDQRYFRELLAGMLAEEGFEAETAASGEEALGILERSAFDIVLTDLVMPGMDGAELVHRLKQRDPDQDVVVVTGVVDVKTAVDAMKLGATDYLLKPFDRRTLSLTLESILQNRRLRAEHERLLAENIEYLGERGLFERALGIFSTLSVEPLAMRIVEALCLETRAQGGVAWVLGEGERAGLDLAAARGLVRLNEEPESLRPDQVPEVLREERRVALLPWGQGEDAPPAAFATLRRDGRVVALLRLSDKLEGEHFDPVDLAGIERFLHFADVALANALRVRWLERRSLRDPDTGVHNVEYFRDAARTEIERASRFGRTLALVGLDLGSRDLLDRLGGGPGGWRPEVAQLLRELLRATDTLAADGTRFSMLLPEADALGASVLKRRIAEMLERSGPFRDLAPEARPALRVGVAVYPGDGTHLEGLLGSLDRSLGRAGDDPVVALGLERLSLPAALQALVRLGSPERPERAQQLVRFALGELGRRPRGRGLVYAVPGEALAGAVREGLARLGPLADAHELVLVGGGDDAGPATHRLPAERAAGLPPCFVHYGDGPAYALVRDEGRPGAEARLFHTSDRGLVEHLAFRLQSELGVPSSLGGDRA